MILEEAPADWREAERRWIAHYRDMHPGRMKNRREGGDGGNMTPEGWAFHKAKGTYKRTEAQKAEASARMKQWYADLKAGRTVVKTRQKDLGQDSVQPST